jgi:hypothetical protein
MLREISTMYSDKKGERYKDLTSEQLVQLDEFVKSLKGLNVNYELPPGVTLPGMNYKLKEENKKLKAQLKVLQEHGYQMVEGQLEKILNKRGLMGV